MARYRRNDTSEESAGQDSFLDLVANIVGILILLVVIVGIRAASVTVEEVPPPQTSSQATASEEAIKDADRKIAQTRAETIELAFKTTRAELEAEALDAQRIGLVEYVAETENHLEKLRQELSDKQRGEYDLNVKIAEAEKRLGDLAREQISLASNRSSTQTLKNVPTPIARKATDKEVTVWVNSGQVSIIPSDELDQRVLTDIKRRGHLPTVVSRVGPLNDFQLHYVIWSERVSIPGGVVEKHGYAGEYRPVEGQRGEPIEAALASDSRFAAHLAGFNPSDTVVTFWVSVNSFGEINPLRELAAKQGFSTAVRPLPEGRYVGFGPGGSQTRAQ